MKQGRGRRSQPPLFRGTLVVVAAPQLRSLCRGWFDSSEALISASWSPNLLPRFLQRERGTDPPSPHLSIQPTDWIRCA